MTLTKEQLDKITTLEQADIEIKKRRELIQQMVGQLYPSILRNEIQQLMYHRAKVDRCPDCNKYGETKGHQDCPFPQD